METQKRIEKLKNLIAFYANERAAIAQEISELQAELNELAPFEACGDWELGKANSFWSTIKGDK